jgi:hypothetical protein
MQNLLFHRFVLFKHEGRALFKHENCVHNFHVSKIGIDIQHPWLKNTYKHVTFVSKQCMQHFDVQTIQIDEWHPCLFHKNLWKANFTWLLLLNHGPWSLWWIVFYVDVMQGSFCMVSSQMLSLASLSFDFVLINDLNHNSWHDQTS